MVINLKADWLIKYSTNSNTPVNHSHKTHLMHRPKVHWYYVG